MKHWYKIDDIHFSEFIRTWYCAVPWWIRQITGVRFEFEYTPTEEYYVVRMKEKDMIEVFLTYQSFVGVALNNPHLPIKRIPKPQEIKYKRAN